MAITTEQKEKFIELRAKGYSFSKISEETGISRQTLIKLNKELLTEVGEAQYFELQNMLSNYGIMRIGRVEALSAMLGSALQELKHRANTEGLSSLPTDKLLSLILTLEERLSKEAEEKRLDFSSSKALKYLIEPSLEVD